MTVWLDAQLSPALTTWMREAFGLDCHAVREHGLLVASDETIFLAARAVGAVVMTKDADFLKLLDRLGPPPQVVWVTCGNTSNDHLKKAFETGWAKVRALLARHSVGDDLLLDATGRHGVRPARSWWRRSRS